MDENLINYVEHNSELGVLSFAHVARSSNQHSSAQKLIFEVLRHELDSDFVGRSMGNDEV